MKVHLKTSNSKNTHETTLNNIFIIKEIKIQEVTHLSIGSTMVKMLEQIMNN